MVRRKHKNYTASCKDGFFLDTTKECIECLVPVLHRVTQGQVQTWMSAWLPEDQLIIWQTLVWLEPERNYYVCVLGVNMESTFYSSFKEQTTYHKSSWPVYGYPARQKFSCFMESEGSHRVHKRPLPDLVLRHVNRIHIFTPYLRTLDFNIILYLHLSNTFMSSDHNFDMHFLVLSPVLHTPAHHILDIINLMMLLDEK
jgi:hypothetical protein